MQHRVLIATRTFGSTSSRPWEMLRDACCEPVQADMGQPMTEERLIALLDGVAGAIVGVVPLTAQVFAHAPSLRVVCMHGVGVDHIDLAAARAHRVAIANCPGANSHAVADLAIGLMIDVARSISLVNGEVRGHVWRSRQGVELWGKTLGLVGLGMIGQGVAQRARGFDMRLLAFDPYAAPAAAASLGVELVALDELLAASDFVSLHAPRTAETHHLIGAAQLALMPPHAYLINTARGELVDEAALHEALAQGRLAGAALDAFAVEPPWGSALLELPNVVATPHVGAHTKESIERVGVLAVRNVVNVLQGKEPLHRVV
jgi:D-3-phosphoglycerate dehydrogenase